MGIKNNQETKDLLELVDKQALYKEIKNNKLSDSETQKFVEAIFENYFLDNDNINFLVNNGINFFNFEENELCFCLSGIKYSECCFANLSDKIDEQYIPFLKAILNKKDYDKYLSFSNKTFQNAYKDFAKLEKCNYSNCISKAVENRLYNFDFEKNMYVSTNNTNPFNNNYKMGDNFFNKVDNNNFKFFGFCTKHYNEINKIVINKESSDKDILLSNFSIILYKLFIARIQLFCLREEYRNYFNSIKDENIKPLFIYNLKRISNHVSSLVDTYNFIKKNINQELKNYKILKFNLPKTDIFTISDLIYPQICPEDFKLVNSINNIFITENSAFLKMWVNKDSTLITIIFNNDNKILNNFFNQYKKIIHAKSKYEAAFISNCALILADNILFDKIWFDKLENNNKALFSALNKFRFEHPNMGQEYLKMKFFAGFNKGNNFF
ncbi:SEC-C metal-binding domain-containing protein [Spiroplasma taiwanense]|uniref:Uncharacterized protein n=1 Tax=Spiroplasma taiwanense CT-1 TaxID=1276220 RepID=S5MGY4_9MOLU|nr:SEC-C domain-containing protein [Spiroplasma taiwanense]AGR41110.1 hypothetical protein STAIW_v1c04670 [Spiroplasma taiwanense CT-1]